MQALKCNRCKVVADEHDPAVKDDKWQRLDIFRRKWLTIKFFGRGIGHYWTVHLCPPCNIEFDKWMKGQD